MSAEDAPVGEANSSTDASDKEFSCPTCDREDFESRKGMRMHHAKVHGESLRHVTVVCENCGDAFEKEPHHVENSERHYCSKQCQSEYLSQKVDVECLNCGDIFERSPSGVRNRNFCSRSCTDDYLVGEKHTNYKWGKDREYGSNWWQQRKLARQRDSYECQICGKGKGELDRLPDVHHIIPIRTFDDPNQGNKLDNLITLCRTHHRRWEGIPLRPEID